MKWGFGIRNKITLSIILCVIFAITFVGNIISKSHVDELGSSFSSVYKDRLVVESYIYRLSEMLHQKKIMLLDDHLTRAHREALISRHKSEIIDLLSAYDKTKLTPDEGLLLKRLKSSFAQIALYESYTLHATEPLSAGSALQTELDLASDYLRNLSSIQLTEASNLNKRSGNIVAGAALISEMGTAVLICLLLVVQVLIFSSGLTRQKTPVHFHLN